MLAAMRRVKALFRESPYSLGEEIVHAATHGLGAFFSLIALGALVLATLEKGGGTALFAALVYGGTLIVCFLSSSLYHGLPRGRAKEIFLLLDHCAIYLLIAGTVTPFALLAMAPGEGAALCVAVWLLAVLGIALKVAAALYPRLKAESWIAITLYLLMGWLAFLWHGEGLLTDIGPGAAFWLVVGGVTYTAGVLFYLLRGLPFNHTIWHLFVLAAASAHFIAIYGYVLPQA